MLPHVSLMLPQFLWIFFMFPLLFLPISYFRSYNQKLQKLTSYISLYVSVYCNKLMYITLHPLCLKLRKVFFAFVFVFFFVCLFVFFFVLFCFSKERKIPNARRQKQPNSYFQCEKLPSKRNFFT